MITRRIVSEIKSFTTDARRLMVSAEMETFSNEAVVPLRELNSLP